MRRFVVLAVVVLVLGLAGGVWAPAPAQDAPPPAGDALVGERPVVGSAVRYVNAEGEEQGIVTVEEVQGSFADFPADDPPAPGARYAVLIIAFEATGEAPFAVDPSDLLLQDADGFLLDPDRVPRGEDVAMPDLESQHLAPGNRISGAVGFVVPANATVAQIYYQPESGQLILLADLQPGAERPVLGSAVRYIDGEGVERGSVTVQEAQDPFKNFATDDAPDRGTRYVILIVVFEATGEASFATDPADLVLQDADGFLWGETRVPRETEDAIPNLESQRLASGNRISGAVGFVVPASAQLTRIFYQPESGHLILLADLLLEPA